MITASMNIDCRKYESLDASAQNIWLIMNCISVMQLGQVQRWLEAITCAISDSLLIGIWCSIYVNTGRHCIYIVIYIYTKSTLYQLELLTLYYTGYMYYFYLVSQEGLC